MFEKMIAKPFSKISARFTQKISMIILLVFLECISLFGPFFTLYADDLPIKLKSDSVVLMNADTGTILYSKNLHKEHYPASTTKVATALYALKKKGDSLNEVVRATQESIASISSVAKQRSHYTHPSYWIEIGSSHMGIKLGEEMSYRDLLYGMLVASANDAANVIAFNIGEGSIPTFMDQLNTYLKQLGCQNTHFNNPHGLFHPKHKTTVYDMALITREALKEPLFRQIVSTVKCMRPPTNKQPSIPLVQTNRLLKKGHYYYPYAIGVKTGYTSDAQHTFVGAAKKDQRSLIAVLFKCKERGEIFQDCIQLFEWAFSEEKIRKVLIKEGPQKFVLNIQGAIKEIHTVTNQEIVTEFFPSEEPKIKCLLHWENIQPPVKKGQKVGFLMLSASDGLFNQSVDLFAEEDVPETFQHWLETVVLTQGYLKSIVLFLGIFLILGGTIYWVIRRKR